MNILFTPARIGSLDVPNRIVMPPMTTRTANEEGYVTEDTIAYYRARARGGVGLITVEMASPEKAGRHRRREVGIYDDRFLPGLTRLVDEIHRAGSKASIQLGHGGGHTRRDICGETPIAPSAIPHPVYETTLETIIPEEMTTARIEMAIAARGGRGPRSQRRLRLRRDPRRPRLSHFAISRTVREPSVRSLWWQPREPRPLRARGIARGQGSGGRNAGRISVIGRGLLPRRIAVHRGPADCRVGGGSRSRRAARHRRALSFLAVRPGRAPTDELSGRNFCRSCRWREETHPCSRDRRGPARRSDNCGGSARRGESGLHRARPHAHRRSAMG